MKKITLCYTKSRNIKLIINSSSVKLLAAISQILKIIYNNHVSQKYS